MSLVFVDRYQSILVLPPHRSWPVAQRKSWLCQYLGVLIPQLAGPQDGARSDQHGDGPPPPLICACNKHVIDMRGDHILTCKKHTGSTKDAHVTIWDALEKICLDSDLSTQRHNIPSVRKANGKTGRGDLVIKDANLGGSCLFSVHDGERVARAKGSC